MENKNYWYFRFTSDFFTDGRIRNMRHIPLVGYKYIVIYLELCSLAMHTGGYIMIDKTASEKTYTITLAKDIGEDVETVSEAISYYILKGLVEVYENVDGTLVCIPYVKNNSGKSSLEADRIRQLRHNQKDILPETTQELPESERPEPEKDTLSTIGIYKNVYLTKNELFIFKTSFLNYETLIENLSIARRELFVPPGIETKSDYIILKERGRKFGRRNRDAYAILLERITAGEELPAEACDFVTEKEYKSLIEIAEKKGEGEGDNG